MSDGLAPHAFLAALQLADSFFPSGMFTQSHGLESFVAAGVTGEERLEPLLHTYLLHAAAPVEALATRWVVRAAGNPELVAAIDRRLEATKLSSEGRIASKRCGGRLLTVGADIVEGDLLQRYAPLVASARAPGHQAVVLALIAAGSGLDQEAAVLVELYTFAVSLVSAAIRLGALEHRAGQRLLRRARPIMAQGAALGAAMHWSEMGGFAPQIDLMQFGHAFGELHMFVS